MFINKPVPKQKAFLVGVCLKDENFKEKELSLDELERLADTADVETEAKFIQNRTVIDKATYVGKGFLEDILNKMEMVDAQLLIFDNELSPTQNRNITKISGKQVIDRTEVILDIFHNHARTKEAKLQVKLAELKYQLPRLKRLWSHLDRERGASGSGKGASRGMGEKQIQIDKRIITSEIGKVKDQLKKIDSQESIKRKKREDIKKVCLVGYTNAGKSTLFNSLTDAGVLVEDKLFATLESTVRALKISKVQSIVLSDTVGFIANLPHLLVASFRATLKEVVDADLLIHLVDISDDNCEKNIASVRKVLEEIDCLDIPTMLVFNKVDNLPEHRIKAEAYNDKYPKSLIISAKTKENLDQLYTRIDNFFNDYQDVTIKVPLSEQKLLAELYNICEIKNKRYEDNFALVELVISNDKYELIKKWIVG